MAARRSSAALHLCLAATAAALLSSPLARAQQAVEASDVTVFSPDAFADAQPANALDMVRRVPGFRIVEGDEDVRGYAGAVSNVRIDGEAPGKREDLDDLLARITAADVVRIELIRGGAPGIDMAGHSVVVNVIRSATSTRHGALEGGALLSDEMAAPLARAEFSRRWGERRLDLALSVLPELDDDSGRGGTRVYDGNGNLLEDEQRRSLLTKRDIEALLNYEQTIGQTRVAVATALRAESERESVRAGSDLGAERGRTVEDAVEGEIGLRAARAFGERAEVEAAATQQRRSVQASSVEDDGADREEFAEDTQSGETIGRVELNYEASETASFTASIEAAFNFLESETAFSENGAPVELPGADVRVEEQRAEASAGLIWRAANAWLIEPSLRLERSTISQTGDRTLERSFFYPKPRLALTWDLNSGAQFRFVTERVVGQLDFEDFVASASLDEDVVTAGNAELAPDQTWRTSFTYERRFAGAAALVFTYHHDIITDAIDRVPIVSGADTFDAPGNIGDGVRDTIEVELALPLARVGVPGGRLVATGAWRWSEVTDPTTGEARPISQEAPFEGELEFTQDLPWHSLSWGVEVVLSHEETEYRFDRITIDHDPIAYGAFAERRFGGGWRLRVEAIDVFTGDIEETQQFFTRTRASELVEETEVRTHRPPGALLLDLRREF